jgi:hypothetical protein
MKTNSGMRDPHSLYAPSNVTAREWSGGRELRGQRGQIQDYYYCFLEVLLTFAPH